ncbi:MAG TPA: ATP-binding protein [Gemmatimonadales bacterium]|nr:ATP-binding protein [Gemmatimonadales bacterium]
MSKQSAASRARLLVPATQGLLAAIVESSEDAIISKTLDGVITSWNAAAQRLFGWSADEAVGKPVVQLLIPDDRQNEEKVILDRIHRGERINHFETVRRTKEGRLLDISLTISPIRGADGEIVGASKIARDITSQKRIECELKEANQRKNEFLALLAHELRNPLGPIRHAVKILRARTPHPDELAWATGIIDRQTEHMTRLVEDLLDVARITRGTITLRRERVDIGTILKAAVEATSAVIGKSRHQLRVAPPPGPLYVEGDPTRLMQCVANLLDNAAKYTDPGGRIWLSAQREGEEAVIRVRDSGIGISADMLPRIFEMFTQAGLPFERSHGGLGVGLALMDRLIALHGGAVSATSPGPGAGSEFTIRLPVADKSQKALCEAPLAADVTTRSRCRVLIVDDNVDSVDSLAMLLGMMGHDVKTANKGREALTIAPTFHPDVAILDIGLPKMNGYELAQRLRQEPWAKDLVLVALSGWGQEEHRRLSAQSGFNHHLTKPVELEALQEILNVAATSVPADS